VACKRPRLSCKKQYGLLVLDVWESTKIFRGINYPGKKDSPSMAVWHINPNVKMQRASPQYTADLEN